jgi:hypothetical protein
MTLGNTFKRTYRVGVELSGELQRDRGSDPTRPLVDFQTDNRLICTPALLRGLDRCYTADQRRVDVAAGAAGAVRNSSIGTFPDG